MLTPKEKKRLRQRVSLDNQRATDVFAALSDPTRCKVFRLLTKEVGLNVGEVASILEISMPLASQHLKILENTDLLTRQKKGREVFYKVKVEDAFASAIIKSILP